jgi:hypothetical protein
MKPRIGLTQDNRRRELKPLGTGFAIVNVFQKQTGFGEGFATNSRLLIASQNVLKWPKHLWDGLVAHFVSLKPGRNHELDFP